MRDKKEKENQQKESRKVEGGQTKFKADDCWKRRTIQEYEKYEGNRKLMDRDNIQSRNF